MKTEASTVDRAQRLSTLWIAWFLAMLFHVDLGLMPLFHGQSVEIHSHLDAAHLPLLYGSMLGYMLLPLASLVLLSYSGGRANRRWQLWFGIVYSVTNLLHLIADIAIPDRRADQILLMVVLLLIGLAINREAWLWCRRA